MKIKRKEEEERKFSFILRIYTPQWNRDESEETLKDFCFCRHVHGTEREENFRNSLKIFFDRNQSSMSTRLWHFWSRTINHWQIILINEFLWKFFLNFQCQWENWETFQKFFARVLGFLIQSLPNEIWRYFYENIKPSRAHESRKINLHFFFTTRQAWWIAKIIVVEELPSHSELIYFIFIFIFTKNVTSFFAWIHANIVKKRPALNFMAYPICKISWWQQKMCILATFFTIARAAAAAIVSAVVNGFIYMPASRSYT